MVERVLKERPEYRIEPVEGHIAGDSIIFGPFTVIKDGSPRDLSNDTIEWYLHDDEHPLDADSALFAHTDDVVEITEVADSGFTDGRFQVQVAEGATNDLFGTQYQRAIVETAGGKKQTWLGSVEVIR